MLGLFWVGGNLGNGSFLVSMLLQILVHEERKVVSHHGIDTDIQIVAFESEELSQQSVFENIS